MIADTTVLSSSPWCCDQILVPMDLYKFSCSPDTHSLDMDIAALEAEIQKVSHQKDPSTEISRMQTSLNSTLCGPVQKSLNSTSCGTSLAGSECSDDVYIDIESDNDHLFSVTEDQEYLTSSLLNMLGGHNVADTPLPLTGGGLPLMTGTWDEPDYDIASLNDLVSDSLQTDLSQYDTISSVSAPCSPQPQHKRSHSPCPEAQHLAASKHWSLMTNAQQVSIIEDLTKIISNEMGLREQMEIIRIINPSACVSTNDTEFVIDLECLNNDKLELIRELVKQHGSSTSAESRRRGGSSSSGSCVSDSSSDCGSPSQKKQTKRQRRCHLKEERQRQRKEYRQMLKEKKSGLFQKEEVLALSTTSPNEGEDDDIDILV